MALLCNFDTSHSFHTLHLVSLGQLVETVKVSFSQWQQGKRKSVLLGTNPWTEAVSGQAAAVTETCHSNNGWV